MDDETTCFPEIAEEIVDEEIDKEQRRYLRAELPDCLNDLYKVVLTDSLRSGVPIRPDALVVVLSAHVEMVHDPLVFTNEHVQELLWFGIHEFCEDRSLIVPERCFEALHAVLASATKAEILSENSDRPGELLSALQSVRAS